MAGTTAVPAATILYEPFDYPVGSLNGRNGGTGFSGAWNANSTIDTEVRSPGLSYGSLTNAGNKLVGLNSMLMNRLFSSTGLTSNGSVLWFSVLFSATDTTVGTATAIPSFFSNITGPHGQANGFAVSYDIRSQTSLFMDARIGGVIKSSTTITGSNYYSGDVAMVLGRITFSDTSNDDRLEVWLNPALETTPGTPLFNVTGQWIETGTNNAFYMNKYNAPDRMVDEIRLGTTLADVMPVPEPAAAMLAVAAVTAGGALCRPWRHRARPAAGRAANPRNTPGVSLSYRASARSIEGAARSSRPRSRWKEKGR